MLIGLTVPASARESPTPFEMRAVQLPDVLSGKIKAEAFFSPTFLNEIPAAQIRQIADQLVAQHGAVRGVEAVRAETRVNGEVDIGYDRATVTMQLVTAKDAPNFVIGLQVTGVRARDDSLAKLSAEFASLPGKAGFLIARHGRANAFEALAAVNSDDQLAVGSTFKLWVLAEAVAQVKAGTRKWSDVVPLGPPSLPSGITQDWPVGSPMTLHSLATLMISVSDNSATDTLMTALGRENLDNRYVAVGRSDARNAVPILTTLEAFVLKMPMRAKERAIWEAGPLKARRALLKSLRPKLAMIDRTAFGDRPAHIDSIEWFASPSDIAESFSALRLSDSKEALDILAINRPLPPNEINRFAYVGYKGGSEVGVMSMSYLIKTKAGDWFTVTGTWNNPTAAVDERQFEALLQRGINLIR